MLPTAMFPKILILMLLSVLSNAFWRDLSIPLLINFSGQRNTSTPSAEDMLSQGIDALGGTENLTKVSTVTYVGESIYRSRSLMQSYSLATVDTVIATTGRQNVSFSFDQQYIKQRIDRVYELSPLWLYARPQLKPMDYSLVIHGGDNGFACVVRGSDKLFAPDAAPAGYKDGLLAAYLIHEAHQMSPLLLSTMLQSQRAVPTTEKVGVESDIELPAVHDPTLNLTVIFNQTTHLPHAIRSRSHHPLLGPCTHDLVVWAHATDPGTGARFPTRFKHVLNNRHVLHDYAADRVLVNAGLPPGRFAPHPSGPGGASADAPARDARYAYADIAERWANHVWAGPYTARVADVAAERPFADMPGAWVVAVAGADPYRQVVVEVGEDGVVVLDAPPRQGEVVVEWVREVLGRRVAYVWPSHHHHDHSMGVREYVDAGAKVIVWEGARAYYERVEGAEFVTYSTEKPFFLRDERVQVGFVHIDGAIHAVDEAYAIMMPANAGENSSVAVFQADYALPGHSMLFDQNLAAELLNKFAMDRVARSAVVVPAHGAIMEPLADLIEAAAFVYPEYTARDYKFVDQVG